MKRTAKAHWAGTLKEGNGSLTTQSGVLSNTKYSFKTRFEEGDKGTNPEELIAAASAGCFTMWVSSLLTQKNLNPGSLDTEATITMEDATIKEIHLKITGAVTGISADEFTAITRAAEKDCIVSKALGSIKITSEARLIS